MGRAAALLVIAACGRYQFAPLGSDGVAGGSSDGLVEGVEVPAGYCADVIPAGPALGSDLAAVATHDGFIALWGEPAGGALHMVQLDPQRQLRTAISLPITGSQVGGITDIGTLYLIATATPPLGGMQATMLDYAFATATPSGPFGTMIARDPFVSNQTRSTFALIDASGSSLELRYFFGNAFGASNFAVVGLIDSIAGDDGPAHGHIAWAETGGACDAGHVAFGGSPGLSTFNEIADCQNMRIASGPAADDAMMVVWTNAAGAVQARYPHTAGGVERQMSPLGRSPKVRFDGTRFWITWMDASTGSDVLMLATFAIGGVVDSIAIPGWQPVDDEAFEIIRDGTTVYLVVLTADSLRLLHRCP